jgi:CheY-like chemotaxis protein
MQARLVHPHTSSTRDSGLESRKERLCLLVADGNPDVHAIYGAVLEHEGFRVLHAFSAAECLRLAGTSRMCAVLVSVGGCGLLDWRRLHQLAAASRARGFAIVCLTTDERLSPDERRPPRGVSVVVMLPCTPEALAAEVRRVVAPGAGEAN